MKGNFRLLAQLTRHIVSGNKNLPRWFSPMRSSIAEIHRTLYSVQVKPLTNLLRNQWDVQCLFCSSDILQSEIHVTRQCTAKCHKPLGVLRCSVMHNVPYNTIWNLLYNAICNVLYCYAIHGNQSIQFWWRPGDHLEKLSTHCMFNICIAFLYISIAFVLHFIFLYHICIKFVYICITFVLHLYTYTWIYKHMFLIL